VRRSTQGEQPDLQHDGSAWYSSGWAIETGEDSITVKDKKGTLWEIGGKKERGDHDLSHTTGREEGEWIRAHVGERKRHKGSHSLIFNHQKFRFHKSKNEGVTW